jgi:hypothetical protein
MILINNEKAGSATLVLSSPIRVFIHHPPLAILLGNEDLFAV